LNEAYLVLENGDVFNGKSFGYESEAVGELVFSTGMTGYLENLADPTNYGQIIMQTFPLIGNYGSISEDFGPGGAHLKAYIVRDWCQEPSNFRSEGNLDSFLREKQIPGIYGIDTRKLTRILRNNGTMNAMLSKTPNLSEAQMDTLKSYKVENAVASVADKDSAETIAKACCCSDNEKCKYNIALWNLGSGYRLSKALNAEGICVSSILPYTATTQEILTAKPDAVVISGGPGNPVENTKLIDEIKKLCDKNIPILAVGLGYELLALANGAKTEKMLFGHRGANQAVKHIGTSQSFVTVQNHGYTIVANSLPENAAMSYVNVNDGSCEGIEYTNFPAISVSFTPTADVLNSFKKMIEGGASNASK